MKNIVLRRLPLLLLFWSVAEADQIIDTYRTTPVTILGAEDVLVTENGSIVIAPSGSSNYAISASQRVQAGFSIVNRGLLETSLDNSGGWYSVPILLLKGLDGEIANSATVRSTVEDSQLAYAYYIASTGSDATVRNSGEIYSSVQDQGYGVGIHVRTNEGVIRNENGGRIDVRGRSDSQLYGLATIGNRAGALMLNDGVVATRNTGDNGGGAGLYAVDNDGEIRNTGTLVVQGEGADNEIYGINVYRINDGIIRNSGSILVDNPDGSIAYAFNTGGGSGRIINESGGYAYGDVMALGQSLENYGRIDLYSMTSSVADSFHAFEGSVLGIKTDLDAAGHPLYSNLEVDSAVLEDGSGFHVDVAAGADRQLYIGQRLDGVVDTRHGLQVNGDLIVTDNSALLEFVPEYDTRQLDLVIRRAMTFSRAADEGSCTASARGIAGWFDRYTRGTDADIDRFVEGLFTYSDASQVAESLQSAIPLSSLQLAQGSLELSRRLGERISRHNRYASKPASPCASDTPDPAGVWMELFGGSVRQGCQHGYRGYEMDYSGVIVGTETGGDSWRYGIAFSALQGDLESNGVRQREAFDRYDITFYGSLPLTGAWQLGWRLGGGWQQSDLDRVVDPLGSEKSARHDDYHFYAALEAYRSWKFGNGLTLYGGAELGFAASRIGGYTERGGGGLNNEVGTLFARSLEVGFGGGAGYRYGDLYLEAEMRADYDLLDRETEGDARLVGDRNRVYPLELDYGRTLGYQLNLSLTKKVAKGFCLSLEYGLRGRAGGSGSRHLSAGFRWRF
jgi:hypothetical protein